MAHQNEELEDFASRLEKSGNYRILRRLTPGEFTPTPSGYSGRDPVACFVCFNSLGADRTIAAAS
jgi:hypothetical protein